MATTVTLEQCGHNHGYLRVDNCSFCPESHCCMEGGPDCMHSVIDMDAVCRRVNSSGLGVTVSVSKDAGRYGPFSSTTSHIFTSVEFLAKKQCFLLTTFSKEKQ